MACCGLSKLLCGLGRAVYCLICSLCSLVVSAIIITVIVLVVLRTSENVDTEEATEDADTAAMVTSSFTLLKTATFSSDDGSVGGILSLVGETNGTTALLAFNDLAISSDCQELEVRLLEAASTSFSAEGLQVVPITADVNVTADFTEALDDDFNAESFEQAAVWCTASDGVVGQLGNTADLETPTTLTGGNTVIRQATLSGDDYTVEGLVQMIGAVDVVDDILVTTYSLRFEDIDVSSGPDLFIYLTTDEEDPEDVDADGSLKVLVDGAERGTFSVVGTFSQDVPDGFISPDEYVAAVVWCDAFNVYFGSGLFVDT